MVIFTKLTFKKLRITFQSTLKRIFSKYQCLIVVPSYIYKLLGENPIFKEIINKISTYY